MFRLVSQRNPVIFAAIFRSESKRPVDARQNQLIKWLLLLLLGVTSSAVERLD